MGWGTCVAGEVSFFYQGKFYKVVYLIIIRYITDLFHVASFVFYFIIKRVKEKKKNMSPIYSFSPFSSPTPKSKPSSLFPWTTATASEGTSGHLF